MIRKRTGVEVIARDGQLLGRFGPNEHAEASAVQLANAGSLAVEVIHDGLREHLGLAFALPVSL